jgi:hypothetical protein
LKAALAKAAGQLKAGTPYGSYIARGPAIR